MDRKAAFTRRRVLRVGALAAMAGLTLKKATALASLCQGRDQATVLRKPNATSRRSETGARITVATVQAENFEALLGERMRFVSEAPEHAGTAMQVLRVKRHQQLPAEIGVPESAMRTHAFSVFFDCNGELPLGRHTLAWIEHPVFAREAIFMAAVASRSGDRMPIVYEAVFN